MVQVSVRGHSISAAATQTGKKNTRHLPVAHNDFGRWIGAGLGPITQWGRSHATNNQGTAGAPLRLEPRSDAALSPTCDPAFQRAAAPVVAHTPRPVNPLKAIVWNVAVAPKRIGSVAAVGLPDEHTADLDVLLPTVKRQLFTPNTGDDVVTTEGKQAARKRRRRRRRRWR